MVLNQKYVFFATIAQCYVLSRMIHHDPSLQRVASLLKCLVDLSLRDDEMSTIYIHTNP